MIATIIKILGETASHTESSYIRVEFQDEGKKWYKTDLVRGYRNFKNWEKLLKVGNMLSGLILKDKMTVDADSPVKHLKGKELKKYLITKKYNSLSDEEKAHFNFYQKI